ncbi:MAG: hypothetical protein JNK79_03045 [Chitinophagaceae bacterium]|nr:hypothetical protein [Chitinophagaceae bacterium]
MKVSIYDNEDKLIEEGDAIDNGDELNWLYKVTVDAPGKKIIAKAYDLPENETVKEIKNDYFKQF